MNGLSTRVYTNLDDDVAAIARIDAVSTILEVICRTTGMGFAAVARVTEDRWIACGVRDEIQFGLQPGGELKVETTICNEIRTSGHFVVIDHVVQDANFCRHPTPAMYGFQSYISMPIMRRSGEFFGTLCAIDPSPAKVNTPETINMFRLFADLISLHLDANERLETSQASLMGERQASEMREQFIAVLGHDLRNPLASLDAGMRLLRKTALDEKAITIVNLMQNSVKRMVDLTNNLLDFARGRLGHGLTLELSADKPLTPALEQVVAELRSAWPERRIDLEIAINGPVRCDRERIAQLFSNLLANAIVHGAKDQPVVVVARTRDGLFELSVANAGEPIPAAKIQALFQPFFRGESASSYQGLGLGLYIASEIARAHGGKMDVTSDETATRFTFSMPSS